MDREWECTPISICLPAGSLGCRADMPYIRLLCSFLDYIYPKLADKGFLTFFSIDQSTRFYLDSSLNAYSNLPNQLIAHHGAQ